MKTYIFFLLGVVLLITGACQKIIEEVDYKFIQANSQIIVQGYLYNDSLVAYVNKTSLVNDTTGVQYLNNAKVSLFQDDKYVCQLLPQPDGAYLFKDSILLEKDSYYQLQVEADSMKTAMTNKEHPLFPIKIDSVYVLFDSINWLSHLFVDFFDTNKGKNIYSIGIKEYDGSYRSATMYDSNIDFSKISYYRSYKGHLDSAIITITAYSEIIPRFENSYLEYDASYGEIFFETILEVENYVENGYGFLGSLVTTTYYLE